MEYRKYAQIWNRYLPVIRILLKKSLLEDQTLNIEKGDFEKVGTRKSGYKFKIEFNKGKVNNIISGSEMASELANSLLENEGIRNILTGNDFLLELNTKYQLKISSPNKAVVVTGTAEPEETPAADTPE